MGSIPGAVYTQNTSGASDSGNTKTPSNQLNANSFISLLTAELQAQDPSSPMDPSTMMNQLVSMNSLQTLLNIQQILSKATGIAPATSDSGSTGTANQNANSVPAAQDVAARSAKGPSASNHDAIFQSKQITTYGSANQ